MIKLDNEYWIEMDAYNWILKYESEEYAKEVMGDLKMVTTKDEWYYPTLRMCLKSYCDKTLKECSSIEKVIERIDDLNDKIEKFSKSKIIDKVKDL